jgi:hypothetical protein
MDHLGEEGVEVYSRRLADQLNIYVHLPNGKTSHVEGPGNHSDLTIAMGLALLGIRHAVISDESSLVPTRNTPSEGVDSPVLTQKDTATMHKMLESGGVMALVPIIMGPRSDSDILTPEQEMARFASQLGGVPIGSKMGSPYTQKVGQRKNVILPGS